MRKFHISYGLAFLAIVALATAANAGTLTMTQTPATANAATVTYDPANGNLSYAGNGTLISTMELQSPDGWFIPANLNPALTKGPFDVFTSAKFFQLITAGTEGADFGQVLAPNLTGDALMAQIAIDGSIKPSGKLDAATGGGPYLYVVPEPSSVVLVCCGLLGLFGLRRR
jgi:hypothetical protein